MCGMLGNILMESMYLRLADTSIGTIEEGHKPLFDEIYIKSLS